MAARDRQKKLNDFSWGDFNAELAAIAESPIKSGTTARNRLNHYFHPPL
jgi:hypothetical protein